MTNETDALEFTKEGGGVVCFQFGLDVHIVNPETRGKG